MPYPYLLGGPIFCRATVQPTVSPFSVAGARPRIHDLTSSLKVCAVFNSHFQMRNRNCLSTVHDSLLFLTQPCAIKTIINSHCTHEDIEALGDYIACTIGSKTCAQLAQQQQSPGLKISLSHTNWTEIQSSYPFCHTFLKNNNNNKKQRGELVTTWRYSSLFSSSKKLGHFPHLLASWCWLKKKIYKLKVENYVLFSGQTEDLSPGHSLSDSSEGMLQKGKGGAKVYTSFCNKDPVVRTLKDYW